MSNVISLWGNPLPEFNFVSKGRINHELGPVGPEDSPSWALVGALPDFGSGVLFWFCSEFGARKYLKLIISEYPGCLIKLVRVWGVEETVRAARVMIGYELPQDWFLEEYNKYQFPVSSGDPVMDSISHDAFVFTEDEIPFTQDEIEFALSYSDEPEIRACRGRNRSSESEDFSDF